MQKQSSKENDFFEQHYKSILKNIDEELPQDTIENPIEKSKEKEEDKNIIRVGRKNSVPYIFVTGYRLGSISKIFPGPTMIF